MSEGSGDGDRPALSRCRNIRLAVVRVAPAAHATIGAHRAGVVLTSGQRHLIAESLRRGSGLALSASSPTSDGSALRKRAGEVVTPTYSDLYALCDGGGDIELTSAVVAPTAEGAAAVDGAGVIMPRAQGDDELRRGSGHIELALGAAAPAPHVAAQRERAGVMPAGDDRPLVGGDAGRGARLPVVVHAPAQGRAIADAAGVALARRHGAMAARRAGGSQLPLVVVTPAKEVALVHAHDARVVATRGKRLLARIRRGDAGRLKRPGRRSV